MLDDRTYSIEPGNLLPPFSVPRFSCHVQPSLPLHRRSSSPFLDPPGPLVPRSRFRPRRWWHGVLVASVPSSNQTQFKPRHNVQLASPLSSSTWTNSRRRFEFTRPGRRRSHGREQALIKSTLQDTLTILSNRHDATPSFARSMRNDRISAFPEFRSRRRVHGYALCGRVRWNGRREYRECSVFVGGAVWFWRLHTLQALDAGLARP